VVVISYKKSGHGDGHFGPPKSTYFGRHRDGLDTVMNYECRIEIACM